MSDNFFSLIEAAHRGHPDRVIIETQEGIQYRGHDLLAGSGRYAALLAQLGAGRGDRVVVQADKSVQSLLFYLACLRLGVIYVPLNTAYRRAELEHFLGDAQPKLVICSPHSKAEIESLADTKVLTLDEEGAGSLQEALVGVNSEAPAAAVAADDIAVIIYTSGTTGRSKGAMITHRNLSSNTRVLVDYWAFSRRDVLVHALPIFHIHGLFVANHTALVSGAKILWHRKFDPKAVLAALPNASVLMGVPTFYTRLLAEPGFGREAVRNMRLFISGSAPLLLDTFSEFEARTGHRILERYGMSEAGMITSNPLQGIRAGGTVGLPLPGNEVRVAGENDHPVRRGEAGAIQIKGDNVFAGYWRMPEKTKEEFIADGWFKTGDVGMFDEQGYLSIVGRAKDLIISGGYNVYPKEVELVLDALPGVLESAVIGVPHPDFGEAVTAVLVLQKEARLTEREVIAQVKAQLASYKTPKRIHIVEDLPRNAMGKVQKNILREKFSKIL
ncbi:MAG: malonyl-CoA synthase [Betaproteobacteria bacterium]|nr:malonyl-CoA synthase [Betaproteobacteria bacterium]